VNALLNVGNVLYAAGRTNSGCTSGSAASPKGWVGRFVGGAWEPVGSQTGFDKEVLDLRVSGNKVYASGAFTNGAVFIDAVAATSSTAWSTFTGNPLTPNTALRGSASSSKFKSMLINGNDLYLVGDTILFPVIKVDMTSGAATGLGPSGVWDQYPNGYSVSSNAIVKVGTRLYMAYENPPAGAFAGSVLAYSDDYGVNWSTTSITGFGRRLATDGTNLFVATATALLSFDGTTASTLQSLTYGSQALTYSANQLCYAAGENTARLASSPYSTWTNLQTSSIVPYAAAFVNGKCYFAGSGTKDQTYTASSSWVVKWDMPPPSISPATQTRTVKAGTAISSTTVSASAFTATPTFSISPSLPTGLNFNTATGAVTGTPTTGQSATAYTITATAGSEVATSILNLTVTSLLPTTQTVSGNTGTAITATSTFTAVGLVGTITYAVTVGSMPTGLSLNTSTGVVSGTPTATSGATLTITATGSTSGSVTATVVMSITPSASVSPSTQTISGASGTAISPSSTFTPQNFSGAVSYAVTNGSLPTGLSISSSTGVISGTPTIGSTGSITITATGATSGSATATVTFNISFAAPTVSAITPSSGPVSGLQSVTITGTGFRSGATVTIGSSTACTGVTVVSATSITCTTSASTAVSGVAVRVTNSDSQYGELGNAYSYTTTTTTTVPGSNSSVSVAAAPTLVTSANQSALEAAPGEAVAIINGRAVAVETVKVKENATPAVMLEAAKEIVAEITKLLPAGKSNDIKVVKTDQGAELTGLMINPDDPKEKLNVPVESVTLVKAGNSAVLISALNQTNLPAEVVAGGEIQVTRGGLVAARAYGLPGSETGEIVLMSTPRLLQRFTVSANGTYNGQVPLPKDISFGSHTVVMATANAKVSLGIKLVRTKMQFRIKRTIATTIFKNRAGVKKAGGKVTITGVGRCKATSTKVTMSAKAGRCFITVKQAAKGKYPAIYYRFTVQIVTKLIKPKK